MTEFQLGNPHARIYMEVRDENGETRQWIPEGGPRTVLLRLEDLPVDWLVQTGDRARAGMETEIG